MYFNRPQRPYMIFLHGEQTNMWLSGQITLTFLGWFSTLMMWTELTLNSFKWQTMVPQTPMVTPPLQGLHSFSLSLFRYSNLCFQMERTCACVLLELSGFSCSLLQSSYSTPNVTGYIFDKNLTSYRLDSSGFMENSSNPDVTICGENIVVCCITRGADISFAVSSVFIWSFLRHFTIYLFKEGVNSFLTSLLIRRYLIEMGQLFSPKRMLQTLFTHDLLSLRYNITSFSLQ